MTETLILQNVAYLLASRCEGERFSYLFSFLRKIKYKLDKNGKNSGKNFSLRYLFKKIQSENIVDVTLGLNRSLHKPRKLNETLNSIFGLGNGI